MRILGNWNYQAVNSPDLIVSFVFYSSDSRMFHVSIKTSPNLLYYTLKMRVGRHSKGLQTSHITEEPEGLSFIMSVFCYILLWWISRNYYQDENQTMFPPPTQSAAVLLKNTTDLIKLFDICPDMSVSIINLSFTSQFQFWRSFSVK